MTSSTQQKQFKNHSLLLVYVVRYEKIFCVFFCLLAKNERNTIKKNRSRTFFKSACASPPLLSFRPPDSPQLDKRRWLFGCGEFFPPFFFWLSLLAHSKVAKGENTNLKFSPFYQYNRLARARCEEHERKLVVVQLRLYAIRNRMQFLLLGKWKVFSVA